jgi:hypothetical protein
MDPYDEREAVVSEGRVFGRRSSIRRTQEATRPERPKTQTRRVGVRRGGFGVTPG